MEAIKTSVTNSPAESEVKGKAIKKSGKRIGYNYIILRSLKESQKNDVVTCLYIKSLTNFGICVIKEGTYGDTKDKQGRDIKDRLMWQRELHEQLQGKVRLPRLLGSFEENGNYYLVLERIRGKSLHKACREAGKDLREGLITGNKLGLKFLGYMIKLIELMETLHGHQIVHRDVTATNFIITPTGKVAVIDMELSYSLLQHFPSPPFQLGTHGYMSPEQEITQLPTIEQDVFSVGAILLQMWTNIWPTKLTSGPLSELRHRIRFLVPDKEFSEIIVKSLHADPRERPGLRQIHEVVNNYKKSLEKRQSRQATVIDAFSHDDMLDLVQKSINTLSTPLLADEEKGWFSENGRLPLNPDRRKINKTWYSSFHNGASGVMYLLSKARSVGFNTEESETHIEKGLALIESRYIDREKRATSGLYLGGGGIAAVLATSMMDGLVKPQSLYFEWINQLLANDMSGLAYQNGIAGQGIAYLLCSQFMQEQTVREKLSEFVSRLINEQHNDGSWQRTSKVGKVKATRGFANGAAGIAYFLMNYATRFQDNQSMASAQLALNWLVRKSVKRNGAINWHSSSGKGVAPWLWDGAPGIALAFLKGYSITGDKKYKEMATGALRHHSLEITEGNLSQSNGLAGLGEIYLEAHKVLGDQEWEKRADWIARFIMHMKIQQGDEKVYWLVQQERQPVADFMAGISGVIHFLIRYCYPDKITFPLAP